ncbi:hypothetical protein [Streptomyces carpinensis]|uniref:Uncharacterized protein n=1 Tax=Streptomyces carpinensis TaxID=66369 RepID=A0ABV1W0I2_9ACTN|nr:hypothetical protein [Streptomyces carpinensis]
MNSTRGHIIVAVDGHQDSGTTAKELIDAVERVEEARGQDGSSPWYPLPPGVVHAAQLATLKADLGQVAGPCGRLS